VTQSNVVLTEGFDEKKTCSGYQNPIKPQKEDVIRLFQAKRKKN